MKNKKIILLIILILAIIIGFSLFYFYNKNYSHNLVLSERTWNEYGSDDSIVRELTVKKGDIIFSNLQSFDEITFTITKSKRNSITIKTNQPMSLKENEENKIDLQSEKTDFTLEKGNTIFLTTPTMDAGATYKLELK